MNPDQKFHFGPLISSGMLLGIGMGGFVDGILFHQILQVHNMLSGRVPVVDFISSKVNMMWDGYFHAAVYLITALGLIMLFRAGSRSDVPWSGRTLFGAWLSGFGLFNLVEGIIDHEILNIHHVLEYVPRGQQIIADLAFLASGILLLLVGWVVVRSGKNNWLEDDSAKAGAGVRHESPGSSAYLR